MIKTGISMRVGTKNFLEVTDAFAAFTHQTNLIRQELGDLTRPFNEIVGVPGGSRGLIPRIQSRFDTNELSKPPYRDSDIARSDFTQAARFAKSHDPNGSTLNSSGNLKRSIYRKPSPTKGKNGAQREVYKLVIGVNGGSAPYYKDQLMGGVWNAPVRKDSSHDHLPGYFDPDRLPGSVISSADFWGKRWAYISSLPENTTIVTVPATNFLFISTEDAKYITNIFSKWFVNFISSHEFKGVPF